MEEDSSGKSKKYIAEWPLLIFLLLTIVIIVFLIWFFTRDSITTSGNNPEIESADSVVCDISGTEYPFFDYDNSIEKNTKITTTFRNKNLDTISLLHTLHYTSMEDAKKSETLNHAALNINTQNAGLGSDIFNAHYAIISDALQLLLTAKSNDITDATSKYLLLESPNDKKYTKSVILQNYKNKGFSCEEVNQ